MISLFHLRSIELALSTALTNGEITLHEYEKEWAEILSAFGWSHITYANEVDRRWEYLMQEPSHKEILN